MAKKNTAIEKKGSTALTPLEQELAQEARDEASRVTMGVPRVTHKSSVIKIDGKPVKDNRLQLAVVDYVLARAYYEQEDFDDSSPQTPVCYAFAKERKDLKPHEEAPQKQHEQCNGCPHDKFGTAKRGRGKRCKDELRVLVLIGVDAESDGETVTKRAELRQVSIPPGSLKGWGKYLSEVKDVSPSGNPRTVLSEMHTEPGDRGGHVVVFKPLDRLTDDAIAGVLAKRKEAGTMLYGAYPNIEAGDAEEPAPRAKKAGKRKYE